MEHGNPAVKTAHRQQNRCNMEIFWIIAGSVIVIPLLAIAIILLLSNLDAHFTKIEQGTTVFIGAGELLKEVWPNVGGYKLSRSRDLDSRKWLIPAKDDREQMDSFFHNVLPGTQWFQRWLWRTFGVRFVSFFWPHTHKLSFVVSRRRLLEGAEIDPQKPLRDRVKKSDEESRVNSLLFLAPRPVFVSGIELAGDNSRVDTLFLCVWQQVIPALPAIYLRGDFFPQLDAAIEAAMVDLGATHRVAVWKEGNKKGQFAADFYDEEDDDHKNNYEPAPLTYAHWLKIAQTGAGSPLERFLRPLNFSRGYYDTLRKKVDEEKKAGIPSDTDELVKFIEYLSHGKPENISGESTRKKIPGGIVPRFGFALRSIRIIGREAHADTQLLAKALLAKETSFHTAEGIRQEAYGARDAVLARTEAEANRFERLVTALTSKGVSAEQAADVVRTQLRMENIRESNLTTYVEGSNGEQRVSMMIPAQPASPPPASLPTPQT